MFTSTLVSSFLSYFLLKLNKENTAFPFGIGINRRDDGISKESELLWFTKDDFNQKIMTENGDFISSSGSFDLF